MASLNVWLNGDLVGVWNTGRGGTPVFRYTEEWAHSPRARALSLSLPITETLEVRGAVVNNYFDNLLPDNADIRRRIRDRFGLRSTDTFELLQEIGRDCVGAVQLLPKRSEPTGWDRIEVRPLSDADVAQTLRDIYAPLGVPGRRPANEFRVSIAGAQEKTALLRMGGRWYQPLQATPTTHILKLPLGIIGNFRGDFSNSVENEWFCMEFLRELGFPTAKTQIGTFDDHRALIVERFDRRWIGSDDDARNRPGYEPGPGVWIARLPQEDFCQATGRPASRRYEADGGPSIEEILGILANADHPDSDREQFVLAQLAFWLLAAIDGHAKNFSIWHRPYNVFGLTPLYDVLSAWPVIGRGARQLPLQDAKLAMAIAGRRRHYGLIEIQARHWRELATRVGSPELWQRMNKLVERSESVLDHCLARLPDDFPESVAQSIAGGVRQHRAKFLHGLE